MIKLIDSFDIPSRSNNFSAVIDSEKLLNSSLVILSFGDELYNGNSGTFTLSVNDKAVYISSSLPFGASEIKILVFLLYCGESSFCLCETFDSFSKTSEKAYISAPNKTTVFSIRDSLKINLTSTGQVSFGNKLEVYSL